LVEKNFKLPSGAPYALRKTLSVGVLGILQAAGRQVAKELAAQQTGDQKSFETLAFPRLPGKLGAHFPGDTLRNNRKSNPEYGLGKESGRDLRF